MEDPVLELLASHRSIRRFRPEPVADELIERCVTAAQMAATSSHVQAYSLLQVTDPARRATLRELCGDQAQVEEAGAFFCVCAEQRRHRLVTEDAGQPLATNLETFLVAVIDAALFAQNLCLAFEAQGLGCCYIGGLRTRLGEVDALLELPPDVFPLFGLCVGHPAEDPAVKPRLPLEGVLFRERYPDDAALRRAIAAHDETMGAYYAARGAAGRDWSGGVWRKLRKPAREHLADYYRAKGARLD